MRNVKRTNVIFQNLQNKNLTPYHPANAMPFGNKQKKERIFSVQYRHNLKNFTFLET